MKRFGWVALVLVLPLLLGLGLSQVLRDTTPPRLFLQAPDRAAAGSTRDVLVSANEPVAYVVRYGDVVIEEVGQDLEISLWVEAGTHEIVVVATDGAGNATELRQAVTGVAIAEPRLQVPAVIAAGAPVTLELEWKPANAEVTAVGLVADGVRVPVVRESGRAIGFVAAPLSTSPATISVEGWLLDAFGRRHDVATQLEVLADPSEIEELNVPASTLSVITPEGRVMEREALGQAYASPLPSLRWSEPFVLPVDGVVTSSYGGPRRYAPGGPVSFHTGTDLRAPTGTPIVATNAGIVRVADFYPIKGGLVAIDHGGGLTSLYFHQSKISVSVGEVVDRGQVIGESGATGLVTGPHLHWEMQVLGRPSDPMSWVGRLVPGRPLVQTDAR